MVQINIGEIVQTFTEKEIIAASFHGFSITTRFLQKWETYQFCIKIVRGL